MLESLLQGENGNIRTLKSTTAEKNRIVLLVPKKTLFFQFLYSDCENKEWKRD